MNDLDPAAAMMPWFCLSEAWALAALVLACSPKSPEHAATETDSASQSDSGISGSEPTMGAQVTTGSCMGAAATLPDPLDAPSGAETTAESGTDTDSHMPCPEHTTPDACCCFERFLSDVKVACDPKFPCQEMVFKCLPTDGGPCPDDSLVTDCVGAIDCSLGVLAKDEPGTLRWTIHSSYGVEEVQLFVVGDGTAFTNRRFSDDLSCLADSFERRTLKAADSFNKCKSLPSTLNRFHCIREALSGEPIETCFGSVGCSP